MDECFRCPPEKNCADCSGAKDFSGDSAEREALVEALLDKLMPIPEDIPTDFKNVLREQRLRLKNRCGWELMSTSSLLRLLAR